MYSLQTKCLNNSPNSVMVNVSEYFEITLNRFAELLEINVRANTSID
jgi:hypothetical protein